MGKFIDLLGQRFGKLTVIERMPNNVRRQAVWKCRCDCGNEVIVEAGHLRGGHTQSCGCYCHQRASEYHTTHGMKGTKLFSVYHTMKGRCYNPNDHKYYRYGARGIKVCDEWLNNPKSFFEWALANGYKEGLSIDRINNDGDYSPDNCRWTNNFVQANNKSTNRKVAFAGESKTMREWANELGLTYSAVKSRIDNGTFEKYFGVSDAMHTYVSYQGITKTIKGWAEFLGMNYSTIRARVRRGTFEKLFPIERLCSRDAYAKGDKVSHNSKHWKSDVDANVWEPGVYGWSAIV